MKEVLNEVINEEQDCFAYRDGKCSALKKKKCRGIDCGFYKTKEQHQEDYKKAIERISALDEDRRNSIIENYYGGRLEG